MKMPEKYDPLAAILAAKEQGIGAILGVCNGVLFAADIMAACLLKNSTDNDVRHYRPVYSWPSISPD